MSPNLIHFRIQTAAGYYSTLTGVLAGFVFTALMLMLGNPPAGQPVQAISVPLLALLMVFFSLVVASFLFAVETGDESDLRAHVVAMLASAIFGLASVEMFLGVVWFFGAYQVGPAVQFSTRLLFHGVVLIAAVWNAVMMSDAMLLIRGAHEAGTRRLLWRVVPALALPVVGALARAALGPAGTRLFTGVLTGGAAFTIVLALYSGVVRNLTDERVRRIFPAPVSYLLMAVGGALLLLCELSLS